MLDDPPDRSGVLGVFRKIDISRHRTGLAKRSRETRAVEARGARNESLLLTFYLSTEEKLEIDHVAYGSAAPWGYGYWRGFNYGYTEVRSYPEGTLVLDIVDARNRKLMWIGILQKEVRSTNPPGKQIRKSVKKLLKSFPPERVN